MGLATVAVASAATSVATYLHSQIKITAYYVEIYCESWMIVIPLYFIVVTI